MSLTENNNNQFITHWYDLWSQHRICQRISWHQELWGHVWGKATDEEHYSWKTDPSSLIWLPCPRVRLSQSLSASHTALRQWSEPTMITNATLNDKNKNVTCGITCSRDINCCVSTCFHRLIIMFYTQQALKYDWLLEYTKSTIPKLITTWTLINNKT